MKLLLIALVLAVAGFIAYPLINEDTSSACDALEKAAVRTVLSGDTPAGAAAQLLPGNAAKMLGQLLQGYSKGQFANAAVKTEHPNLPVSVACGMLYWKAVLNPEGFRKDAMKFKSLLKI